jgi:hypothetical protein
MTRQRIRQVEQACTELAARGEPVTFVAIAQRTGIPRVPVRANLHPVDGSLSVFGQVGQLLPRDALAANEGLLAESTQHLLLQRLGRVRLRPSSIRASSSIDIAGFSGTTRVFQTQAPPRDAKRARQLSPSVVATTPAQYLVRHRCGCATPRRTLWSCHWSRPATAH